VKVDTDAVLQGARNARFLTGVIPVSAWLACGYLWVKGLWLISILVGVIAATTSAPHVIAHSIAARDIWRARDTRERPDSVEDKP
jgi:hypothetical protein